MNNYEKIYWLTRLDNIQSFLTTGFILSLAVLFMWYMILFIECYDYDDRKEYIKNHGKYRTTTFWLAIIFGVLMVFSPSKNDMLLIVAGGKTMDYIEKDTSLSKIPYQTTSIISNYLDKELNELKEGK